MSVNEFGLEFHHFGLAVRSPQQAFRFLQALGYQQGESVFDPLQSVNLVMCYHADMPDVEVIWPGAEKSPLDAMLKRQDSLIYHLCYTAADPQQSIAYMEKAGLDVLPAIESKPAVLFGGYEVSFYFVAGFGLIELIHCSPADAHPLKNLQSP